MRFLADENFPRPVVEALRAVGFDVAWVHADTPGASDEENLARALRENRVLLTFDLDFGELVVRRGAAATCGVVLFRLRGRRADRIRLVVEALQSRPAWSGYFSIVELGRIRMLPLSEHQ